MYTLFGDEGVTYHTMAFLQIPLMFGASDVSALRRLDLLDLYNHGSLPLDRKVLG